MSEEINKGALGALNIIIDRLSCSIKRLEDFKYKAESKRALLLSPFEIGDNIINSKGVKAIVEDAIPGCAGYKCVIRKLRKDGTPFARTTETYGYDMWKKL